MVRCCAPAAVVCIVLGLPGGAVAAVSTDQPSYEPGSTVTISGDNSDLAGYQPGEQVAVAVSGPEANTSCEATTDAFSGAWSCQITLAPDDSAIGGYTYTATGQTSGVSQSGSFTDSNCPNASSLSSHTKTDPEIKASYTTSGGVATYSFTSPNKNPSKGIPGLLEYCVYTEPQPDSTNALYGDWNVGSTPNGGFFDFERNGGSKDNLPFDGTTQTVGSATWNSGEVPARQIILCHINDPANSPADSFVRCFESAAPAADLTASKTAVPSFTRTFAWGIGKSVDKAEQTIFSNESATFNYTVSVTHDSGTDSGWAVSGKISVSNPNKAAVSGIDVTDAINDANASCAVTGGSSATIPAESVEEFPYSCTYSAAPKASSETNTATVKWGSQTLSDGSTLAANSTTATKPINWSTTTPAIVDGSVSVSDTLGGPLGTVSYTDSSPKEFKYPHTFTGDPAGTCTTHENTATSTTNSTGTKASASKSVKVCVPGCTKVVGSGHYGPKFPLGDTLDDNLNTTLVGKQELQYKWENNTQHWGLNKLTSASCVVTSTERKFSGKGLATYNLVKGYEITFSITVKNGKIYFVAVLEKGGVVIKEFHDEPLLSGKETIS
jgi:hypothetical protein